MSNTENPRDELALKWGTLKRWNLHSDECKALLKTYAEIGSCASAMLQHDTPEQREIVCKIIDACNAETIYLDWDGRDVTKEEAKKYVMTYGNLK